MEWCLPATAVPRYLRERREHLLMAEALTKRGSPVSAMLLSLVVETDYQLKQALHRPAAAPAPATDALVEKLRVRQAVLFRVRSVALRPEERQVLDELLNETYSELAGIHRVLVDARGPEHRGAHTENPNPVRAVNGVRAAPFWETRQAFHIEAARVAARERLSRPESESGERGPLHFAGEGRQ